MLARRFAIVCLLMSLFGMGFAILVAEASRHTRGRSASACILEMNANCKISIRN